MWIAGSLTLSSCNTEQLSTLAESVLETLPEIPRDEGGPVFAEPWQAQVFAMTLALYERGLFTWVEWAEHLSDAISQAQSEGDPDTGEHYYWHWLRALETMMTTKQLASAEQLREIKGAWSRAALATPHGQPIVLAPYSGI